jgi:ubiquinone/menaquinone biosynthesis C-methylase UbiE
MDNKNEIAIDIGGGNGKFFLKMAYDNPEKIFLILDPKYNQIENKPNNLIFINWMKDMNSDLPFMDESISCVHIDFLMGEILSRKFNDSGSNEDAMRIYDLLLSEVDRVLSTGGILDIVDVKENSIKIEELLIKHGYFYKTPTILEDENHSVWSKVFFEVFHKSHRSYVDSYAIPMHIEARKPDQV